MSTDKEKRIFYINNDIDETLGELCFDLLCLIHEDDEKEKKEKGFKRKPIKLYVQSYGGDIYSMWALIDIILSSKTPVHTYCTGYAMSAGFKIFLAGEKRFISKHAVLMYHQLSGWNWGKYKDLKENLDDLKIDQEAIEDYVASRTKISKKELKKIRETKKDFYIRADKAIELGVAHEVI